MGGIVLPFEAGVWLLIAGVLLILYAISQAVVFLGLDPAPLEGRALAANETPALWKLLDSLRRELQCQAFDDVRISMRFNAGVRELPRLGLFGWPRTILDLGLPLLIVLTTSTETLCAVLAPTSCHHSSRAMREAWQPNSTAWLHRTWIGQCVPADAAASHRPIRVVRSISAALRFVNWYWPRLHARALVLSRAHEFHADHVAAVVAGGPTMVSALWKLECFGPWLAGALLDDVYQDADRLPETARGCHGPTGARRSRRCARQQMIGRGGLNAV